MNQVVKFINEKSVDEVIQYVETNKLNVQEVIKSSKEARTEIGLKIQELIERMSIRLDDLVVGTILEKDKELKLQK